MVKMRRYLCIIFFIIVIAIPANAYADEVSLEGKKNPSATLLMNLVPLSLIPIIPVFFAFDEDLSGTVSYLIGYYPSMFLIFPFGTIPAHIYVGDSSKKIIGLTIAKAIVGLIFIGIGIDQWIGCSGVDGSTCNEMDILPFVLLEAAFLGGLYTYEVVDTYNSAIIFNEKLEKEKQNSQSSFFIQPIITPKGDIFLTGGIRF
jgi:hypothetical protein